MSLRSRASAVRRLGKLFGPRSTTGRAAPSSLYFTGARQLSLSIHLSPCSLVILGHAFRSVALHLYTRVTHPSFEIVLQACVRAVSCTLQLRTLQPGRWRPNNRFRVKGSHCCTLEEARGLLLCFGQSRIMLTLASSSEAPSPSPCVHFCCPCAR